MLKLPRLPINWITQPQLLERYWDLAMTKIEDSFNQLLQLPIIQQAIIDLGLSTAAAQADAAAAAASASAAAASAASANATANTADTTATSVQTDTALVDSYVSGFVAPLLSITSTGSATIADHNRVYGDGSSVAVTGGAVATGATSGQTVRVYYNDPTRAGGAVTYLFTVDPAAPPVQKVNTHSVGAVLVPAAGSNNGKFIRPPGFIEV